MVEETGIEPATSTLARRDRSLAVTPRAAAPGNARVMTGRGRGGIGAGLMVGLPYWCSRYGILNSLSTD
jgi:hypothetical protein